MALLDRNDIPGEDESELGEEDDTGAPLQGLRLDLLTANASCLVGELGIQQTRDERRVRREGSFPPPCTNYP